MIKAIYFDNAATTRIDEAVAGKMLPFLQDKYGNASSTHSFGKEARKAIEDSRKVIAKSINARAEEIIFTSGGTESNNLALKGLFFASDGKKEIVTTVIEHESVLKTCAWLEKQGCKIVCVPVGNEGFLDLKKLEQAITKDTLIVSIIHGNNEIGTIQDISKIGKICGERNVIFHVDACQSFLKTPIDVEKMRIDLLTINAHKIHGPKGIGALYVKSGIKLIPLLHGGWHEFGLRSGTENVAGIAGFAKAIEIWNNEDIGKMMKLRDVLIEGLLKIPYTKLNGYRGDKRLCNNVNVAFYGIDADLLASYLDAQGIFVSSGSACSSHKMKSSHVLQALGDKKAVDCSIRFSLGRYNTVKEIDETINVVTEAVEKLRI
jgi:cysteine desulfurase